MTVHKGGVVRLISYRTDHGVRLGALKDDGWVDLQEAARTLERELPADMRSMIELGDAGLDIADQALRSARSAPLVPGRIVAPLTDLRRNVFAVGRNYQEHREEAARARGTAVADDQHVVYFSKPPSTVIGHEADVEWDPAATSQLDYEVELVIVIGRRGKNIPLDRALDHVYGYTVGNDVSARDAQKAHGQWFKGKSMDTFCPLGPCIVPSRYFGDAQHKRVMLRVNGETRQDSNTEKMIFDIPTQVHELSLGLTLEPGDLIMTGTPSGVAMGMTPQRWLRPGDVVEAEIEDLAILRNRVVEWRPPTS